jgi:glycerophosphoryl diester phosphodiesterase
MERRDLRSTKPQIIAHRGASGHATENSLAAFRRAVALGADAVELDVHATRDGVLLVHHDATVEGLGTIATHTCAALATHRLANGEPIPTLAQALEACEGVEVWIEVKTLPAALDRLLLETIDRAPAPDRCAVHGFDHRIVARLGRHRPTLRRGALLASYLLDTVGAIRETGAKTLWQECHLIDESLVQTAHLSGLAIVAWTVNDDIDARRLTALGVDGLCGNFPDRLLRVRDQITLGTGVSTG